MNDRVINPLHWSFVFSMLVKFLGVLLVSAKKVSVHVWVKKLFSLSGCTLLSGLIFFSFLFPDWGCHPLAYPERQVPLRGVPAPPVWNISVLFIIILGTPSVSVMSDSFELKSVSDLSIPSSFSCAFLDYHGHGRLFQFFIRNT